MPTCTSLYRLVPSCTILYHPLPSCTILALLLLSKGSRRRKDMDLGWVARATAAWLVHTTAFGRIMLVNEVPPYVPSCAPGVKVGLPLSSGRFANQCLVQFRHAAYVLGGRVGISETQCRARCEVLDPPLIPLPNPLPTSTPPHLPTRLTHPPSTCTHARVHVRVPVRALQISDQEATLSRLDSAPLSDDPRIPYPNL